MKGSHVDYHHLLGKTVWVARWGDESMLPIGVATATKRGHLIVTKTGKLNGTRRPFVSGSDTSAEAAERLSRLNEKEVVVLQSFALSPHTDEDGADLTGLSLNTYRARRVYLVECGLVRDSGQRARTRAGRRAVVWEAV